MKSTNISTIAHFEDRSCRSRSWCERCAERCKICWKKEVETTSKPICRPFRLERPYHTITHPFKRAESARSPGKGMNCRGNTAIIRIYIQSIVLRGKDSGRHDLHSLSKFARPRRRQRSHSKPPTPPRTRDPNRARFQCRSIVPSSDVRHHRPLRRPHSPN